MFWAYRDNAVERYFHFNADDSSTERWLNRLVLLGKIEEEDWHRESGKFFKIPVCCREWFIALMNIPEASEVGKSVFTDMHFGKDHFVGYVRCPKCRIEGGFHE